MRKMYVCSRPIKEADGNCYRHLLGILSQDENKNYQFEYALGDEQNNNNLLLPFFPDANKIYNDHDTRLLLDEYLPSENDTPFINQIVKQAGLKKYDEWEWLRTFEPVDENSETILYETLPDNVIVHDYSVLDSAESYTKELLDMLDDEWDDISVAELDDEELDDNEQNIAYDDSDYDDDYEPEYFDEPDNIPFDEYETEFEPNDMPFDDIVEPKDDKTDSNDDFDINAITISEPIIETHAIAPVNPSAIQIKKTTVTRTIKTEQNTNVPIMTADAATALVQKRLEQNIKERHEKLKQTLNSDNTNDSM